MLPIPHPGVRAVLLAAGHGKRMKSAKSKLLHEVLGKTILSRVIEAIDALQLEHLHLIVGHGSLQVCEFLEQNPPQTPWSTHLQEPQLGTGHALMQVAPALQTFTGTVLVCPGDSSLITAATLQSLIQEHKQTNAAITVLTTILDDAKNYGRIFRADDGRIVEIVEDKDASAEQKSIREINAAIYCFEWGKAGSGLSSLSNKNQQGEYYLTDLIGWAGKQGLKVEAKIVPDWSEVAGINSKLELAEASRLLQRRVNTKLAIEAGVTILDPESTWIAPEVSIGADTVILPGCLLFGDIEIGRDCQIGPHTVIHGPVKIGDRSVVCQSRIVNSDIGSDTWVGPFAHLRDRALVGDAAKIGNFVEIKKSMIGKGSKVSHLSYVGDATVGQEVNIGAGTITANYDSLSKVKSKTVIGDHAATGSNAVLVAPVEVGPGAMVAAGTVVTRDVPPGSLAVGRARQETKTDWADKKRRKTT